MRKLSQSRPGTLALAAFIAFLALESSASAWPVNRFYGTQSTRTVATALRHKECTGRLFPPAPNAEHSQRRPVNRFHRSNRPQSGSTSSPKPRFFLFNLFR